MCWRLSFSSHPVTAIEPARSWVRRPEQWGALCALAPKRPPSGQLLARRFPRRHQASVLVVPGSQGVHPWGHRAHATHQFGGAGSLGEEAAFLSISSGWSWRGRWLTQKGLAHEAASTSGDAVGWGQRTRTSALQVPVFFFRLDMLGSAASCAKGEFASSASPRQHDQSSDCS